MLRSLITPTLLLCFIADIRSQDHRATDTNTNFWLSHWGDHRLHDRWSIHTEGHWRRTDLGERWQQLLLRPAVNFHLNEQVLFTQGYSYYVNYPYSTHPIRFQNWEHHLWQQVQLTQTIGRVRVQHRFRAEERFIARLIPGSPDPSTAVFDGYGYQNRIRYRVWVTIPLGGAQVTAGRSTVNFYDEVFLSFGDPSRLDHMNQNRISALLGYQISEPFNLLAGYLYQTSQRPGAAAGRDLLELNSTVHVVLIYNLDLRRKDRDRTS